MEEFRWGSVEILVRPVTGVHEKKYVLKIDVAIIAKFLEKVIRNSDYTL